MSDFESRVRAGLGAAAAGAPLPHDLAAAARTRSRSRRRTSVVVAAAVALTAAAVPALMSLGVSDDPGPGPGDPDLSPAVTTHTPGVPSGWRVETWRDVEVRVPTTWGYGSLSAWCIDGAGPGDPVVERPGGAERPVSCRRPRVGYGVTFLDPAFDRPDLTSAPGTAQQIVAGSEYPAGAWAGYAMGVNAGVLVVAPTENVARYLLDSFRPLQGVDGNNCAPQDSATTPAHPSGLMSICRYTADGWLQQSELLSPTDTDQALQAVQRAPETAYAPRCLAPAEPSGPVSQYVVMLSGDTRFEVVWEGSRCADHGVFVDARERRELTEDVLYWALSPGWSGSVSGDVNLPEQLRR